MLRFLFVIIIALFLAPSPSLATIIDGTNVWTHDAEDGDVVDASAWNAILEIINHDDLEPENIRAGIIIGGVTGSFQGTSDPSGVDTSDATALANHILSGYSAYGSAGTKLVGTVPVRASVVGANGNAVISLPDGYYESATVTATDSDLLASNIKLGVNIFGVNGTLDIDALAAGSWTKVGSDLYYGDGNVGIGVANPTTALDVLGTVKATSFAGDGSSLTGVITSESDPKVGTLTNGKWCSSDGSQVLCTNDAPTVSESDPSVAASVKDGVDVTELANGAGLYLDYRPNNAACSVDAVLKYDASNSRWICGSDDSGVGSESDPTVATSVKDGVDYSELINGTGRYLGYKPSNSACGDGQVLKWDNTNSRWLCDDDISSSVETDPTVAASVKDGVDVSEVSSGVGKYFTYQPNNAACTGGQVLKWDDINSRWACSDDINTDTNTQLSEAEVDTYVANNGYLTSYTESDPVWTAASGNYYTKTNLQTSGQGQLHWGNLTNIPAGFSDGIDDNTQLSEAQVDTYVSNNGYLTSYTETDPTVAASVKDGVDVSEVSSGVGKYFTYQPNNAACTGGQVLKWDDINSRWACSDDIDTAESDTLDTVTGRGAITTNAISTGAITATDLEVDTNTLSVDATNNRVGIGTISPSATLEVSGEFRKTGSNSWMFIKNLADTSNGGSFREYGINVSGDAWPYAAGTFAIKDITANQERFVINSLGNVGIGKTNPSTALDVNGTVTATSFSGDGTNITNVVHTESDPNVETFAKTTLPTCGVGEVLKGDGTNLSCVADADTAEADTLDSVTGRGSTTTNAISVGAVTSTDLETDSGTLSVDQTNNRVGIGSTTPGGKLVVVGNGNTSATYGLNVTDSGGSSNLFVRDDGNIGIGVTSPVTKLHIEDGGLLLNGSGTSVIELNRDTTGTTLGLLQFQHNNTTHSDIFGEGNASTPTGGDLVFRTRPAAGSLTERMRVDENGNVGIGTTSPDAKVDIEGAGASNAKLRFTNTGINGRNWELIPGIEGVSNEFFSLKDVTAGAERIVIDNLGNVGIGTTTPSTALDVSGTVTATAFSGDGTNITNVVHTESDPNVETFAKTVLPTCGAGEVLKGDGTSLSCVADNGGVTVESDPTVLASVKDGVDASEVASGVGKYFSYQPNNAACTNAQVLKWDNTNSWWICSDDIDTNTQLDEATVDTYVSNNGYLTSYTETDPNVETFAKTTLPTCGVGEVLKGDGTNLSCVADADTAEADTLDTVTGRGATTTNAISVGAITATDLEVDTNTLSVDTVNNRVGIGTLTPATALDVNGTITASAITGLSDPTSASGAATKQYVDNLVSGLTWKDPIEAAQTLTGVYGACDASKESWASYNKNDDVIYVCNGTAWVAMSSHTGIPNATTLLAGKVQLTGVLNGTYDNVGITDGSLVDADISATAAIAGTKVSPDFGSQNIVTTGAITADSGTLAVDAINNRVGIGTTTPGGKLVVVGNGNTSATYGLNVTNSGGVSHFFVRDDGNVGIGTTTPGVTLDVNGAIRSATDDVGAPGIQVGSVDYGFASNHGPLDFYAGGYNTLRMIGGSSASPLFFSQQGGDIRLYAGNTIPNTGLSLESDGSGSIQFRTNANSGAINQVQITHTASAVNYLSFTGGATGSGPIISSLGSDIDVDLTLSPKGTGSILMPSGNVGIGTNSPGLVGYSKSLTVQSAQLGGTSAVVEVSGYNTVDADVSALELLNGTNRLASIMAQRVGADNTGALQFRTSIAGVHSSKMTIASSGNVGIGTSTPLAKLDVDGGMAIAIQTVTGNYTLTNADHMVLCDATTADVTLTLPDATTVNGLILHMKKIDSSVNTCTIDGGLINIDGATTKVITDQYITVSVMSDGTQWWIQ